MTPCGHPGLADCRISCPMLNLIVMHTRKFFQQRIYKPILTQATKSSAVHSIRDSAFVSEVYTCTGMVDADCLAIQASWETHVSALIQSRMSSTMMPFSAPRWANTWPSFLPSRRFVLLSLAHVWSIMQWHLEHWPGQYWKAFTVLRYFTLGLTHACPWRAILGTIARLFRVTLFLPFHSYSSRRSIFL